MRNLDARVKQGVLPLAEGGCGPTLAVGQSAGPGQWDRGRRRGGGAGVDLRALCSHERLRLVTRGLDRERPTHYLEAAPADM